MKIKKTSHNSVVTKHNDLLPKVAKFQLSELRLIAYCLSHYDSRKAENRIFTAKVDDLTEIFPQMDKKSAYAVVKKAMLNINKKPLQFEKDNKEYFWNWFSGFVYSKTKGEFEFKITPEIQPYLLKLKQHFSRYRLTDVYRFNSAFAWKLYENLNRWKKTGAWYIQLEELKELLGVSDKYLRFNSLREKVIDPAIKEINNKSDIFTTYEKESRSNKVIALKFFIDKKHKEEILNIENQKIGLLKILLICGISHTASNNCVAKICGAGREEHFIKKIPRIKKRWNSGKGVLPKYMLGAINRELEELERSARREQPEKPDYIVSLDCWNAKRQKREICPVRKRGKAGNRTKCKICLEKLKIEDFGV
ncbi:MAG: replication initiation protein [Gammaproteobacteria bacterium]|nr:replication initiation protein [Gammaproteobacteria bacterium]